MKQFPHEKKKKANDLPRRKFHSFITLSKTLWGETGLPVCGVGCHYKSSYLTYLTEMTTCKDSALSLISWDGVKKNPYQPSAPLRLLPQINYNRAVMPHHELRPDSKNSYSFPTFYDVVEFLLFYRLYIVCLKIFWQLKSNWTKCTSSYWSGTAFPALYTWFLPPFSYWLK